jgi:hypothetical protein
MWIGRSARFQALCSARTCYGEYSPKPQTCPGEAGLEFSDSRFADVLKTEVPATRESGRISEGLCTQLPKRGPQPHGNAESVDPLIGHIARSSR